MFSCNFKCKITQVYGKNTFLFTKKHIENRDATSFSYLCKMEKEKVFDSTRLEFTPYGLTCEKWKPQASPRIDRHNEIEINYFPEGGATYLFSNRIIDVPANKLIVFWALFPHKTMAFQCDKPYYTCTIPLSTFLSWKISQQMQNLLMGGHVLTSPDETNKNYDNLLLSQWHHDLSDNQDKDLQEVVTLEMRARMSRFSTEYSILEDSNKNQTSLQSAKGIVSDESDKVSKLVLFISKNHKRPLKLADVGKALGLHPDYANSICRKAFGCTIHEYLLQERINHVERLLFMTDLPISNIAFECGFTTIARFNAAFLKYKGCRPSEYRKMIHITLGRK